MGNAFLHVFNLRNVDLAATSDVDEYRRVFGDQSLKEAVFDVVCRAAAIMGTLGGDIDAEGMYMTQKDATKLALHAYKFVTYYVTVLLRGMPIPIMHRVAYVILDDVIIRGCLIEGDTSANEMLHKLGTMFVHQDNQQGERVSDAADARGTDACFLRKGA